MRYTIETKSELTVSDRARIEAVPGVRSVQGAGSPYTVDASRRLAPADAASIAALPRVRAFYEGDEDHEPGEQLTDARKATPAKRKK